MDNTVFVYLRHFHSIFSSGLTACLQWVSATGQFPRAAASELGLLLGTPGRAFSWEGIGLDSPRYCGVHSTFDCVGEMPSFLSSCFTSCGGLGGSLGQGAEKPEE